MGEGKKAKGEMLEQLVATIACSGVNARGALIVTSARKAPGILHSRVLGKPTYGYKSLSVLMHIRNFLGRHREKYAPVVMHLFLVK